MASHSTPAERIAAWALPLKNLKALVTICLYVCRHLQECDWSCHTTLKGMQSCSARLAHKGGWLAWHPGQANRYLTGGGLRFTLHTVGTSEAYAQSRRTEVRCILENKLGPDLQRKSWIEAVRLLPWRARAWINSLGHRCKPHPARIKWRQLDDHQRQARTRAGSWSR